jgi:hypothetical protein
MKLSYVALLVAASLLFACNRTAPPSPEYAEAREKWTGLLREKLDGAAADPRAEEVLALLSQVDPRSSDAQFAGELKREIETSRAQAIESARQQEQIVEQAQAALAAPAVFDSDREAAAPAEPAAAEPAPDAGVDAGTENAEPTEGMDDAEFRTRFARCFEYKHDSLVGGVAGGKVWGMKDLGICRDLHPGLVGKSVLLFESKVASIRPSAELAPKSYVVVDGKLVPAEEAKKLAPPAQKQ